MAGDITWRFKGIGRGPREIPGGSIEIGEGPCEIPGRSIEIRPGPPEIGSSSREMGAPPRELGYEPGVPRADSVVNNIKTPIFR
ncbi:hypothetical protein SAMN05216238_101218 [Lentibacillus persicus]|uniref:Uncharacterized protein n=1 Tax=Lentibacillus persicus TaxID=640948 RepID=A0A1I1S3N2_9BACI|nr:hypothetical protein [Lentibacillus persicus]SFD41111.1 hypothetical protein SAMN05216238_101218 [Lentibacillus persicus]